MGIWGFGDGSGVRKNLTLMKTTKGLILRFIDGQGREVVDFVLWNRGGGGVWVCMGVGIESVV